jgi:tRNA nucleotidyltransferase/poly(A) polymerase
MGNWLEIANKFFEKDFADYKRKISGGRRPDLVVFSDIGTDCLRRDLTINALFYDTDTHEVVDLVGGIDDLKKGIIRTVGAAEDRFGEDKLRRLRAIRFAGRFGSELDPAVDAALRKDASLEGISGERIKDEFIKGIQSAKSVVHFLQLIDKYGLFVWIFKGLNVSKQFIENKDPIVVIATLLKENDPRILPKKLNELKYKDIELRPIKFLIDLFKLSIDTAVQLKKAQDISKVSINQIQQFASNQGDRINETLLTAFIRFNLTVKAQEVKDEFGLSDGPELGQAILKIETDNFKKLVR